MNTQTITPKKENTIAPKISSMTKTEMLQKMLADQQIIKHAIQNGIPLSSLEKTHGLKFATLPDIKA